MFSAEIGKFILTFSLSSVKKISQLLLFIRNIVVDKPAVMLICVHNVDF